MRGVKKNAAAARPRVARPPAAAPVLRGPQRERHEPDYLLLLSVCALAALGLLMVYSSSGVQSLIEGDDSFSLLGPQAMWAVLGVLVMLAAMRIDYRYLRLISVPAMVVAFGLLTVVLLDTSFGPVRSLRLNDSARWLQIGPLAMHPAEVAKLALVVYLAHWLTRKGGRISSLVDGMLPFLLIVGPVLLLIFLEPDLGTAGVVALTALTMLVVAGASLVQLAVLLPTALGVLAFLVSRSEYQMERVRVFLDPWAYSGDAGYQTVHGLLALGQGGVLGIGLGGSQRRSEPAPGAERLRVRPGGSGDRLRRRNRCDRPVSPLCLPRHQGRARCAGHLRGPAGDRHHRLAGAPGVHQHCRRRRADADHRHHAAVRVGRWVVAAGQLRRGRYPPLDLTRDASPRDLQRCES